MASIITVHGTFASGPEEGDDWWQRGSSVEADLRGLVEGEDGTLEFVPHVWTGDNSETARRLAGAALSVRMEAFERSGEPYCLLGHSHGGSVVLSALLQRAVRGSKIDALSRWITIGTPFIAFSRKWFLFSRLGILGKAAYVTFVTFLCLFCLAVFIDNQTVDRSLRPAFATIVVVLLIAANLLVGWGADRNIERSGVALVTRQSRWSIWPRMGLLARMLYALVVAISAVTVVSFLTDPRQTYSPPQALLVALSAVGLFALFHFAMLRFARRGTISKARRKLLHELTARWLPLRHPQDEAVEGLQRLKSVRFPIFAREFAVSPIMLMVLVAIPLATLLAVLSPAFMNWLHATLAPGGFSQLIVANGRLVGEGRTVAINTYYILGLPVALVFPEESQGFQAAMFLTFSPLLYLVGAVAMVAIVRKVATLVSAVFARNFDAVTWSQIRASAYGNDTQGELAVDAGSFPGFLAERPVLPADLAAEITAVSDAAAAVSVAKLRSALTRLAFTEGDQKRSDLVSDYLTWDELIHTAYFKVPAFIKLVAYGISRSKGFRATAAFRADPDYPRIAQWYASLAPQQAASPPSATAPPPERTPA